MKRTLCFLFVLSVLRISSAFALVPPPGPVSPVFDAINDVIETGKAYMKKVRTLADEAQRYRDEALNKLKSLQNFIGLDLTESPLQKEEGTPVLAAVKDVVENQSVDIENENDVAEVYQKLFLNYPIELIEKFPARQREIILKKYRDKGVEFSNDNMMELYLTIRDLEENRLPAMEKELKDLSDCYVSGTGGSSALCQSASAADEELGNWSNKYKLAKMQDSYLRMYEELAALKAQFEAGLALQEGLRPFNEEEALSSELEVTEQATVKNPSINLEVASPFKEKTPFEGAEDNTAALPILNGIYELLSEAQVLHNTKQELPNLRRPFLEYEKMKALHQVAVSRLLQSEKHVRDYFKNYYQDADGLWFGEGCVLRTEYIGQRCPKITGCKSTKEYVKYDVPVVLCSNTVFQIMEYDKRRGLSKYAYDLYTAEKVEQVINLNDEEGEENTIKVNQVFSLPVERSDCQKHIDKSRQLTDEGFGEPVSGSELFPQSDSESLSDNSKNQVDDANDFGDVCDESQIDGVAVIDLDMDTTTPDIDEEIDLEGMIGGGDDLIKDSDAKYAERAVREQELHRFQIGAIEALMVGADMNSGKKNFGLSAKYPLWQDEMRFYDQYLREKYLNMQLHFNNPMIATPTFDLAREMNNQMKIASGAVNMCKQNVEAQAQREKANCVYWATCTDSEGEEYECQQTDYACVNRVTNEANAKKAQCSQKIENELNKEKTKNRSIVDAAKSAFENNASVKKYANGASELEEFKHKQEKEAEKLIVEYRTILIEKLESRDKVSKELNTAMERLNGSKKSYNDYMGEKKDAESGAAAQDDVIALSDEKSNAKTETAYVSGISESAEKTKQEQTKKASDAKDKAGKQLQDVNRLKGSADEYRAKIKAIDEQIEDLKVDYIQKAVALEYKQMTEMKEKLKEREAEIKALPTPSFSGGTQTIGTIADYAQKLFKTFKENAIEEVQRAYERIEQLGQRKYEADQYETTIFTIHKNMLSNIQNAAYASMARNVGTITISGFGTIINAFSVTNAPAITLAKTVFPQKALNSECDSSKEDKQYFVSLKGESCDLTAPKRLFADRTPPLREVFYFDSADYDSVLKTGGKTGKLFKTSENPKTTRFEFLQMGREIPEIWKIILGPNGFVQRDVDVEDILNQKVVVAARKAQDFHRFVNKTLKTTTNESENMGSEEFLNSKGEDPVKGNVGELSVFLKYDEGLTFRDPVFALALYFDYVAQTDDDLDVEEIKAYKKMFPSRNQVGDYLQFVDLEQTYQIQVAQLKQKVDEGRKTVNDALKKALCEPKKKDVGYVKDSELSTKFVSSEFIADDEVYESVAECLDKGKNMYISEAIEMMKQLPKLNDYLADRKSKLDNMLKTMQIDSSELVQLSDNTEPDGAFEEKIKTKKADGEVVDKYAEEAEAEFERNLDKFEIPYQARYF